MSGAVRNFSRRSFLKGLGAAGPLLAAVPGYGRDLNIFAPLRRERAKSARADLVIIGGGLGGCAAALAAARNGLFVIMTEETDWIGGQLTQQAVPPDENKWIETFGASKSYQTLRTGIREYYRRNYPLTSAARAKTYLNPGNCWVSALGCEPRAALAGLYEMLAPYLGDGRIRIFLGHQAIAAHADKHRVFSVLVRDLRGGGEIILDSPLFADATEQGDLLPMTGTDFAIGAEAKKDTGEPHAKETAQPDNLQGFTFCFAMDYLADEDHTLDRPANYAHWRDKKIIIDGLAPYRLVSFEEHDSKKIGFDPVERKGFWTYRRVADRNLFAPDFYRSDITIVNWPQNDFSFGRICGVGKGEAARHATEAKELSLSLLYWLQTEAPRPDGGTGWKGLRLRRDIVDTEDGMAKYPYIREGRRIKAEFTVLEQHVTTRARMHETGLPKSEVRAFPFPDSVGIGSYHMDLHLTTTGDHGQFGSTLPFQIPLGALLPRQMDNLLPACKNIGVTHLTNGCYRLHPVEWGIGEAAGSLAAFCSSRRLKPRAVRHDLGLLSDFQKLLRQDGVRLEWPQEAGPI
jgi:hypothetical protein